MFLIKVKVTESKNQIIIKTKIEKRNRLERNDKQTGTEELLSKLHWIAQWISWITERKWKFKAINIQR